MRPAIHDGLVLHAPLEHPERMAVGIARATGVEPNLEKRESKLAAFLALATAMGAIVAWGCVL